jgi:OHCU decarboxylase
MDHGLQNFQIYKNLAWLNDLPTDLAEKAFLDCCGSQRWAKRMAAERPFRMLEDLYKSADVIWASSTPADWREAFAAHPRIGSSSAGRTKASEWSADEQSVAAKADRSIKKELAEANRLYEEKFGFIFIVCATGRTAEEILAMCIDRLGNTAATEIKIAAREQQKITELRLNKLLEK